MKTVEPLELATADPRTVVREMTTIEDDHAYWVTLDSNRPHLSQYGDRLGSFFWTRESVTEFRTDYPDDMMMAIWRDGRVAGSVGVACDGEIGYWLHRDQLHQGIATMAVRATIDYFDDRRSRLWARVNRKNVESLAVMRRIGAERSGHYIEGGISWRIFELGGVDHLLYEGEHALLNRPEQDSIMHRYGYNQGLIVGDNDGAEEPTGSLVYAIEPHGMTPPALVTADETQTLRVLRGSGLLIFCNGDTKEVEIDPIDQYDETDVWQGDGFYLINPYATAPLVVRQDGLLAGTNGFAQTMQAFDIVAGRHDGASAYLGSSLPLDFFRYAITDRKHA